MDEALIVRIITEVLAALKLQQPTRRNVLVLFSGASSGVQVGLEAVEKLARAGHKVTVVLSPSASQITGEERIRKAGAQQVIGPDTWANAPQLVRETDLALLPTLSMNFAARLAQGLMDTLLSTLALGVLIAGKPLVAVRDGADLDGPGGRVFGAKGTAPALRARMMGNLQTLASYGVELVSADEFLQAVERRLSDGSSDATAPAPAHNLSLGGVITQVDLFGLEPGSVLHLAPGSRLTPLAQDTAKRLGLQVLSD